MNEHLWKPDPPIEICLYLWDGEKCQKFSIPSNGLDRLDVWLHEFTEQVVRLAFFKIKGGSYKITLFLSNGKTQLSWFEHILTSLVCPSILKKSESERRLIQPNEFYEVFKKSIDIGRTRRARDYRYLT